MLLDVILIIVSADLAINVWALSHVRAPKPPHGPVK